LPGFSGRAKPQNEPQINKQVHRAFSRLPSISHQGRKIASTGKDNIMKRLLSIALALSLLGGSAAVAAPYGYGNRGYSHGNNNGALFAGLGIVALAAILASRNNNHYRGSYNRYDDNRDYRGGYGSHAYGGYGDAGRGFDSRGNQGYGDRDSYGASRHW
jgi:hypothetical protein